MIDSLQVDFVLVEMLMIVYHYEIHYDDTLHVHSETKLEGHVWVNWFSQQDFSGLLHLN